MNPNSFAYFGFLALGALVYHLLPARARRYWLLAWSLIFYWSSVKRGYVAALLIAMIGANYALGRLAAGRRAVLVAGLALNLGLLAAFKYLGFFAELASALGMGPWRLPRLILPLGISFYTFVSCGYLIDVYRGKRAAETDPVDFALFISFFPAILSGPIERADHLLPQLKALGPADGEDLKFAVTRLITGLTKKVLLADSLAVLVNTAYGAPDSFSGLQLMVAAIAYSLQIYFDFSAYSEMAVGAARLFGIRLLENFRAPYLARSAREFWRRWHISLSTWFRDYLYFPLGGSRRGKARTWLNILIVFAFSGLWHGAAVHFVIWGLLCGAYQAVGGMTEPLRRTLHLPAPLQVLFTFALTTVAWIFFRADSAAAALHILGRIVTAAGACFPLRLTPLGLPAPKLWVLGVGTAVILAAEGLEERFSLRERLLSTVWLRDFVWVAMLIAVALFGAYGTGYDAQEFVYFQF